MRSVMLTTTCLNGSNSDGSSSGFEDTLQLQVVVHLQVVLLCEKVLYSFPNPEYTITISSKFNELASRASKVVAIVSTSGSIINLIISTSLADRMVYVKFVHIRLVVWAC